MQYLLEKKWSNKPINRKKKHIINSEASIKEKIMSISDSIFINESSDKMIIGVNINENLQLLNNISSFAIHNIILKPQYLISYYIPLLEEYLQIEQPHIKTILITGENLIHQMLHNTINLLQYRKKPYIKNNIHFYTSFNINLYQENTYIANNIQEDINYVSKL